MKKQPVANLPLTAACLEIKKIMDAGTTLKSNVAYRIAARERTA